jgi:hypothetical protein
MDLGFLMMLPQEAALITSGITKILQKFTRNERFVLCKIVYRIWNIVHSVYVFVPVYLHHVFVCLSRVSHQGVNCSLLVIREECRDWTGCGGAIIQVCVEIPRLKLHWRKVVPATFGSD